MSDSKKHYLLNNFSNYFSAGVMAVMAGAIINTAAIAVGLPIPVAQTLCVIGLFAWRHFGIQRELKILKSGTSLSSKAPAIGV